MTIDIETIGIGFDTSALVNGQRALKDTENAANKTADAADAAGKKGSKGFDEYGQGADRAKRKTDDLADSTSTLSKIIDMAAKAYAAFKVYEYVKDAALLNARYETLGISMTVVGKNAGYTASQMEDAAIAMQKTGISMIESRQQAMRLVQAHIDLSASTKLARIAQDAAVIGNMNSSEAFATLVHGIQTAQTETLRTIGINVSMDQAYKTMAQSLHKHADQLSQNEKTQAILNAVFASGADIAGVYSAAMDTAGKQLNSMKRYTEDLKTMQGEVFNEVLTVAVMGYTKHLKDANGEISDLARNGELKAWGEDLAGIFVSIANAIDNIMNGVKMAGTWLAHQSAGGEINKKYDKLLITSTPEFPFKSTTEGIAERHAQIEKLRQQELASEQKMYEESQVLLGKNTDRMLQAYEERQAAKLAKQVKTQADSLAKEAEYYSKSAELQKLYAGYSLETQRSVQQQLAQSFFGDNHKYKDTQAEAKKTKELSIHEQAAHAATMSYVKAEKDLRSDLEKDMQKFSRNQVSRTKDVTKSIIDGIGEQSKTYLAFNKSLDEQAENMRGVNELAQLEFDLMGRSSVERTTLIEQKKIELALEKQLREIRSSNMSEGEKNLLIDKANSQALIDKSAAELRAQQSEWTKFFGEIYTGIYDSLYRGFEAGKSFSRNLWDSVQNLFKTNAIKFILQGVMTSGVGLISGAASAMSGASSGSNAGSFISIGKSIYEGFSGGFAGFGDKVASFVQGGLDKAGLSMSGGTPGAFASGAGTLASYGAGAAVGIYGGRAISGGYSITGGNAAVNIGTLAGAFFGGPIGAAIGGAIGGLVNRAFGRKAAELQQSELAGSFNASGASATIRDVSLSKGGWFTGDKWTETKSPMAGSAALNDSFNLIKEAARGYASVLGLATSSVDTFTKDFKVNLSITGDAAKDAEANKKIIDDLLISVADELSTSIAPGLVKFSKAGESASATLTRLAGSLANVNDVLGVAGLTKLAATLEGADAAQRLADLSGGLDKFAESTKYFTENFLTDAERIQPVAEAVSATMNALGLSSVTTVEGFKNVVRGLDLSTQSGAELYAKLMALAPAFKTVADSASTGIGAVLAAKSQVDAATVTYKNALNAVAASMGELSARVTAAKAAEAAVQQRISNSYFAAEDAVTAAKHRIADLITQSADSLRAVSGNIKGFLGSLIGSASSQSVGNLRKQLIDNAASAKNGDTTAQNAVVGIAQKLLERARDTSSTAVGYAREEAFVRSLLTSVTDSIDSKITGLGAPVAVDPMVAAQAELVTAQKKLAEASALAAATGSNMDRSLIVVADSTAALLEEFKKARDDRIQAQSDLSLAAQLTSGLVLPIESSLSQFMSALEEATKAREDLISAQDTLSSEIVKAANRVTPTIDDFLKSIGATGEEAARIKSTLTGTELSTSTFKGLMDASGLSADGLATALGNTKASAIAFVSNFSALLSSEDAGKIKTSLAGSDVPISNFKSLMQQAGLSADGLPTAIADTKDSAAAFVKNFSGGLMSDADKTILENALKGAATSLPDAMGKLALSGTSAGTFNDIIKNSGLSADAILKAFDTTDTGLQGIVKNSGASLTSLKGSAAAAGMTVDEFNELLDKNGLTETSFNGLKSLTNGDAGLLAEYFKLGAAATNGIDGKMTDVKTAADSIKARMDQFILPSVSLDFTLLQASADAMAQLMQQFKLPVADGSSSSSSTGAANGEIKSFNQKLVESWYANNANAYKANDPFGVAYWVADLEKNGLVSAKTAFANSVANLTGTTPIEIQKFATGAAFSNGIVTRPTNFRIGQMGEKGKEGVVPLAEVGGKLGINAANLGNNSSDRALGELVNKFEQLSSKFDRVVESTKESAELLNTVTRGGRAMQTEAFV